MSEQRFWLDPDYRRDAPTTGPYCIRCQRSLRNCKSVQVTLTSMWTVKLGGEELMGLDCWKKVSKDPVVEGV